MDHDSGLNRPLALTGANSPESYIFEKMVMGDEAEVFANRAYTKVARQAAFRGRGVFCSIMSRARRAPPLSKHQNKRNKLLVRLRQAVERVIGKLSNLFSTARAQWEAWVLPGRSIAAKGKPTWPSKTRSGFYMFSL